MPEIIIEGISCLHPQGALGLEWLETNGLGGYASSTLLNCHTRKYHGLLVANLDHPAGRQVLLSKVEDSICLEKEEYFFSCHQYPGFFFQGPGNCLASYRNAPAPQFTYLIGGIIIRKTIMLIYEEDCVLIKYELENCPFPALLRLRPFIAYRGFHNLLKQNPPFNARVYGVKNGFRIEPCEGMPYLFIRSDARTRSLPAPLWYYNFEYPAERERGYDWREDLFQPGVLEISIKSGEPVILCTSLNENPRQISKKWAKEETGRAATQTEDKAVAEMFAEKDKGYIRQLLKAGRQFLIRTPAGRSAIIAGYHWFDEWGRDALIALPGLTFCSGRSREGVKILEAIGGHEQGGLLPNFFAPDGKNNAYNSVDASLWYFWAVQQMFKHGGSLEIIRTSFWPVMKRIVKSYMAGTLYDIRMSESGLLHAGNVDTHITWMDAVAGRKPVTPRWGFAVEINALWYNALCFAEELSRSFGEVSLFSAELLPRIARSFQDTFWIEDGAYLGDVFSRSALDCAIRPNQIFAVSLPFSPLTPSQAAGVCSKVKEHLLTPCGLRTLSPSDSAYRGRYEGNSAQRDGAYHQGTVWPWLLGPFGEACLKVAEDKKEAGGFLLDHLRSFLRLHLHVAGVGCISEIFDGDPPHAPRGCISQAWSVGEIIRLYGLLQEIG